MRKSIATMVVVLLLVLIVVVAGIFIMRGKPADETGSRGVDPSAAIGPPRETEAPASSAAPEASSENTETPIATREPLPTAPPATPAPAPTPAPTPKPTPAPTPAPADASGSFRSDTGTGLNLKVDWKTYTAADGTRKLKADVSIISYSIFTSNQYQSITLRVGGSAWSADCPGISYDGPNQITTPAASFTVNAPAAGTAISVDWAYRGSYSGKDLGTITATGTVR